MIFWLFVGLVALLVWSSKLSARITVLEEQLKLGSQPSLAAKSPVPEIPTIAPAMSFTEEVTHEAAVLHVEPISVAASLATAPPAVQWVEIPPAEPSQLAAWIKENTLIKIGAFLFFLGAVWFVSYAIAEGWISPFMRIAFGLLTAVAICAVGYWRKKYQVEHYVVLTALGVSIAIASVYAGQFMFSLFAPLFALVLLLGAIAYAVLVSLRTRTQWLSVTAAVAACLAPFMINTPESDPAIFLTYLLFVSLGFLTVVFVTHWRLVTLILVAGVSLLELITYAADPGAEQVFLVFAPIFTLLFFAASTVSMFKSNTPWSQDVVSLGITSGMAIWWAHTFAPTYESVLVFMFALVCAGVGYLFFLGQKSPQLVSIYAGFASIFILIATSLAFDGFVLTIFYTGEIAMAIILAMYLRFTDRLLRLTALTFVLPVALSITDITADAWEVSVVHPSAFALLILLGATFTVSRVAFWYQSTRQVPLLQHIGTSFFVLCWFYAYVYVALFCSALFVSETTTLATQCILWTAVSGLFITRVLSAKLSRALFIFTFSTLLIPALASFSLLAVPVISWLSVPLPTFYFMTSVAYALLIGLYLTGKTQSNTTIIAAAKIALVAAWLYSLATVALMGSLFVSFELTSVFDYVGFTAVSIALFCVLLSISAPQRWAVAALCTLIVPIILSLPSLGADEWRVSLVHVHALGIGSLTVTLLYMTGMLWQLSRVTMGVQASVFRACTRWIGITGVVYVAILVWLVADALFTSPDVSVSVALFVYTVSGLALYTFGRTHEAPMLRKVGIGVLALVVARLLIIDVWGMAILGRIATFLGVGLLFIVTALFEKPFHQNDKP